ncbi:MAG: ferric reductase-like transmembrane domain-containing protein [Desulfomonile tiedjei]|nr:ferric reductase-like transmembrane domain-containing protein [Desulfomonile tiedjei]
MAAVLAALYSVVALSPLIVVAAIWLKGDMTLMHETGTSTAFAAYGIIALQPVLVARWKWIERPFGLDVVSRFHKYMGVFAVALLLTHPPLMAFGGQGVALLTTFNQPWYVLLGKALLVLLLLHVCLSVFGQTLGLTFEKWRCFHNVAAIVILGGVFVHSLAAGYDLGPIPLRVLWLALLGLTAFAYVHHKILVPRGLRQRPYEVVGIEQETPNVWTVKLAAPAGEKIYDYHPGQFHFLTFHRSGDLPVEEHHWTISSSPATRDFISSTIKESGDFTATIGKTRVGDTADVQGPFGRFCYTLYPEDRDFVFIAGGIGITPLMGMIRHMRDTKSEAPVLLLYANRTSKDIAFKSELAEIESGSWPRLKVVHVLSSPEAGWTGESGRLDGDRLTLMVSGKGEEAAYYICAPPPMTKAAVAGLRSMGVPYARMRTEQFSL